ncbi:MAG: hypothetical protein ABIW31_00045 [Novosphingobium sp.]
MSASGGRSAQRDFAGALIKAVARACGRYTTGQHSEHQTMGVPDGRG